MPITVMLVDDHLPFVQTLTLFLSTLPDVLLVGTADNGYSALEQLERQPLPDVVLMDYSMPGLDGMLTSRQILARHPNVHIIILSMHAQQAYVANAVIHGVKGYVLKEDILEQLPKAIQAVAGGHFYFSPRLANLFNDLLLEKE